MKVNKKCQSCTMPLKKEEDRETVKEKCIEMGIPKFLSRLFVKKLRKLERWK